MNGERPPLEATPLTAISMRSIEWREKPLWQSSAFQLFAAPKGAGKGTYLAGFAARLTWRGLNVLFISTEDSAEIDLKPRLAAAAADMNRCFLIRQHVRLPDDIEELRHLAEGIGDVALIVIDPVANHIGDRDSNQETDVRDAIAPLNKLADDLSCLIVGVRHVSKDRTRGAVASILGSTAWVDTPRAVVMIGVDDEDQSVRHIQVVAGNRSLNGAGQAFRIEAIAVHGLDEPITVAVALGESAKSVEDLLENSGRTKTKTDRARDLLLDILDDEGAQESDALDARVSAETGVATKTVKNTRTALKDEGLVKNFADKDETGSFKRWMVSRTLAPRPTPQAATGTGNLPTSPTHSDTGTGRFKPNEDGNWGDPQEPVPESQNVGDLDSEDHEWAEVDESADYTAEPEALPTEHSEVAPFASWTEAAA